VPPLQPHRLAANDDGQLAAVYMFEYIIQVAAARARGASSAAARARGASSAAARARGASSAAARARSASSVLRRVPQTAGAHSANTDCLSQKEENACSNVEFCVWEGGTCDYSSSSSGQINKNLFVILAFCYQFGVLLSRSSLSYIKVCAMSPFASVHLKHTPTAAQVTRVGIITTLQVPLPAICTFLEPCFRFDYWPVAARDCYSGAQPRALDRAGVVALTSPRHFAHVGDYLQDLLRFMNVWVQFVVMVHEQARCFRCLAHA
jgi:hypothetical protein